MSSDYKSYLGGKEWRLEGARILVKDEGANRTKGRPLSMQLLYDDACDGLHAAYDRFGVPIPWIMGMVGIEATRIRGTRHFDPECIRNERGYVNDKKTPHRRSVGYMQTLLTTARDMNRRFKLYPFKPGTAELKDGDVSLMLGTAYMFRQLQRYKKKWGWDPMICCGAYNAGRLTRDKADRKGRLNRFKIRAYGWNRHDRFLKWVNDACEVVDEEYHVPRIPSATPGLASRFFSAIFG